MESNTKHLDNIFEIVDSIFSQYLHGTDSIIELNDYTITISNIAIKCPISLENKERFIIDFTKKNEGARDSKGRMVLDSDGKISINYIGNSQRTHNGYKSFLPLEKDEMFEAFIHLKRKYNLDSLLS